MIITTPTLTDTALPTPPTSPSERPTDPHSVVLLNSLVQFYQHESLWAPTALARARARFSCPGPQS
ncbi:hypothetical protein EWM64_g8615 [Hericium alpestre]|uniref:Uncharacterized protein n=1 Tax=Hericium alpestre TaxID=135208 RepID=A0A4Y9ZPN9_9AGAM|nr:hypothetical protein EWM64_g8615 [Hericium alpestre]